MNDLLVVALNLKATNRVVSRVSERVRENICIGLTPSGSECTCKAVKRGLCGKCYGRWWITRLGLGDDTKRAVYDSSLIRSGRLLSRNGAKTYKDRSVFTLAAKSAS